MGLSALVVDPPPAVFASYLIRFRPLVRFDSRYLAYFLQSPEYWSAIDECASGIALQNVNATKLSALSVPIAPIQEQPRIVAELEKQLSRIDAGVAALERAKANLERYRASVLKAACEGRLVPTEAELARAEGRSFEPASELLARILKERRFRWEADQVARMKARGKPPKDDAWKKKYPEPAAPDTSKLPQLPEGWCWASLDQLSSSVRNGTSVVPRSESGVRILRISAVRPCSLDLEDVRYLDGTEKDFEDSTARAGDLLFTRYNGSRRLVGVCAVVPDRVDAIVYPDKLIRVRPVQFLGNAEFVCVVANAGESRRRLEVKIRTTAGQSGVSGQDLKEVVIPLAPRAEQAAIVAAFDAARSATDRGLKALDAMTARASRLRQSLLAHAFSGKLVPQDPNDEPASALLERIRKEREAQTAAGNEKKASPGRRKRAAAVRREAATTPARSAKKRKRRDRP